MDAKFISNLRLSLRKMNNRLFFRLLPESSLDFE
jgi:hypothetical protein